MPTNEPTNSIKDIGYIQMNRLMIQKFILLYFQHDIVFDKLKSYIRSFFQDTEPWRRFSECFDIANHI